VQIRIPRPAADLQNPGEVVITRNGTPAAVLRSPEDLESLEETLAILADPDVLEAIAQAEREVADGDVIRGVEALKALRPQ